ncbi:MAG: hypothetical protein R3B11_00415 [Nitrospira sp.]|nr:hypothetical protein [Nitrospira sp.]MDR4474457.1 hypothetical protein [Nitrospira sp.]
MAMTYTMFLGVLSILTLVPIGAHSVYAETEQGSEAMPLSTIGFQSGVIDEVLGSTIRIDGRTYVLKAAAVVVTHEGEALELERIIPTSLVKFHLKEGHIDKMVVTLPQ